MVPSPPALETAAASSASASPPIPADTIGYSIPNKSVSRVLNICLTLPAPPLARVGLDKFENGSIRIVEACEQRVAIAGSNRHRLREEGDALVLQALIFIAQALGEKRDARDTEMVELRVGLGVVARLFPFDEIEPRRMRIVTEDEERGASV